MAGKKEPTLDELMEEMSRLTGSQMKEIYHDFFGLTSIPKDASVLEERLNGAGYSDKDMPSADGGQMSENKEGAGISGDQSEAHASEQTIEQEAAEEEKTEKSGQEQLDELIGLANIKHDVKELTNLMKVQKMREAKGLSFVPTSLHLVFAGNPGTGKTTVARILAKLYKEIGVLSKGQLVEVDRSGLVAGYVGQTAMKTQEKIEEAMGGILFVDEAYTLAKGGQDFGQEAIDTILKAMEDHRKDFIVIVAGYTGPMMDFINSNPGLRSRFNKYLYFEDYTAEELQQIFDKQCEKYSYHLSEEAKAKIQEEIKEIEANKDDNFANAREIRNLFEEIITNQASRVAELEDPTEEELTEILAEDLEDEPVNHEPGNDEAKKEAPENNEPENIEPENPTAK